MLCTAVNSIVLFSRGKPRELQVLNSLLKKSCKEEMKTRVFIFKITPLSDSSNSWCIFWEGRIHFVNPGKNWSNVYDDKLQDRIFSGKRYNF